jgi:hypothetical protein
MGSDDGGGEGSTTHIILSGGCALALQLFSQSVPALGADVVLSVLDLPFQALFGLVAQVANDHGISIIGTFCAATDNKPALQPFEIGRNQSAIPLGSTDTIALVAHVRPAQTPSAKIIARRNAAAITSLYL